MLTLLIRRMAPPVALAAFCVHGYAPIQADRSTRGFWGVATAETVAKFVNDLECRLRGPRWWRQRVVAEMEDGLTSAVASLDESLNDPEEAERRVLGEWGSADLLVAELNEVGARLQTCRVARRILTAVPLLATLWAAALFLSPRIFWSPEPLLLDIGQDALGTGVLTALGASAVILVKHRAIRPARWWTLPYRAIGMASSGLLIAVAAVFLLLACRVNVAPHSVSWPLYLAPSLASLGVIVLTGVDMLAIVRTTRRQTQPESARS